MLCPPAGRTARTAEDQARDGSRLNTVVVGKKSWQLICTFNKILVKYKIHV